MRATHDGHAHRRAGAETDLPLRYFPAMYSARSEHSQRRADAETELPRYIYDVVVIAD